MMFYLYYIPSSSGCHAITGGLLRRAPRKAILPKQKSVVSVIQKHVTTLFINQAIRLEKRYLGVAQLVVNKLKQLITVLAK